MRRSALFASLAALLAAGVAGAAVQGSYSTTAPNAEAASPRPVTPAASTVRPAAVTVSTATSSHTLPAADEGTVPSTHVRYTTGLTPASNAQGVYYQNRVVVLTFHDISPTFKSHWTMTPEQFTADLDALQKAHFNVISNDQFVRFLRHQGRVPDNAVLLTFDDGYEDMYTYALPALQQHHMQGTFFIIVGTADGKNGGQLKYLTWQELQTMHDAGMVLASHTYNSHFHVKENGRLIPVFDTPTVINHQQETEAQYEARILADFKQAKNELETHLHSPVIEMAWPYGWGTQTATRVAESAGYQLLFTTTPGPVTPWTSLSDIPRIDIGYDDMSPTEAIASIIQTARG
ncbi:MAG: polysaccharide deacetylase family protein [Alicyclobacillus sp.]|nr:polysaccharide deacetylase family protein [Alicyclobacillus sp.]